METPQAKPIAYNRWLPYWAVFQADCGATLRSWVYRAWVAVCTLALAGYLVYKLGPAQYGIKEHAGHYLTDLARWLVLGSVALVGIVTASAISGERGTVADSVLSRGISRYQYFMGKWHARLATILGTYLILAGAALCAAYFLLKEENLSVAGCFMALAVVGAMLVAIVSVGVAISAISNSTVMGIAILWLVLYGMGFILACLPETIPAPDRVLKGLPFMIRGYFDGETQFYLILWAIGVSLVTAVVGMVWFSQKDV